ncbi:MAG: FkbM family methyltransferase, partial [Patescibacteria group bacterium]|nr:FkbM family methyltransferase [Patescibacteria group bacterium]
MSISADNFNPHPRLIEHLVGKKVFSKSPLIVVDVGARGGAGREWSVYGDQYELIGFEADPEECDKLNRVAPDNECYYPAILWSKRGKRRFYIHEKHPPTSSLYDSDEEFLSRFPGWKPFMPTRKVLLDVTDFSSFARKNGITEADAIQLDAEGAELEILRGLGKGFEEKLIFVSTEANFRPWGKGSAGFAELDIFMRE